MPSIADYISRPATTAARTAANGWTTWPSDTGETHMVRIVHIHGTQKILLINAPERDETASVQFTVGTPTAVSELPAWAQGSAGPLLEAMRAGISDGNQ